MKNLRVLGVFISNRTKDSLAVQNTLTKYGCSIKTRLGLHEVNDNVCSDFGLILLELTGDQSEWEKLQASLQKIEGVEVQSMEFES